MKTKRETREELRNEDPISGAAGAHPVGTGVGAAFGGTAAGAVVGAIAGPIGAAIGATAGAIAGGYGGKAVAESFDPTVELAYWKKNYTTRQYYDSELEYADYEPAYRMAVDHFSQNSRFEDCAPDLRKRWESQNRNGKLGWDNAKLVMQDAWQRMTGQCCTDDKSCKK